MKVPRGHRHRHKGSSLGSTMLAKPSVMNLLSSFSMKTGNITPMMSHRSRTASGPGTSREEGSPHGEEASVVYDAAEARWKVIRQLRAEFDRNPASPPVSNAALNARKPVLSSEIAHAALDGERVMSLLWGILAHLGGASCMSMCSLPCRIVTGGPDRKVHCWTGGELPPSAFVPLNPTQVRRNTEARLMSEILKRRLQKPTEPSEEGVTDRKRSTGSHAFFELPGVDLPPELEDDSVRTRNVGGVHRGSLTLLRGLDSRRPPGWKMFSPNEVQEVQHEWTRSVQSLVDNLDQRARERQAAGIRHQARPDHAGRRGSANGPLPASFLKAQLRKQKGDATVMDRPRKSKKSPRSPESSVTSGGSFFPPPTNAPPSPLRKVKSKWESEKDVAGSAKPNTRVARALALMTEDEVEAPDLTSMAECAKSLVRQSQRELPPGQWKSEGMVTSSAFEPAPQDDGSPLAKADHDYPRYPRFVSREGLNSGYKIPRRTQGVHEALSSGSMDEILAISGNRAPKKTTNANNADKDPSGPSQRPRSSTLRDAASRSLGATDPEPPFSGTKQIPQVCVVVSCPAATKSSILVCPTGNV